MSEFESREDYSDIPDTDSACPWCGEMMKQGAELRFCPGCPFDASMHADLSKEPPYRIKTFADWKLEQWAADYGGDDDD